MGRDIWKLEKDTTHGTSWRLTVGIPGVPGAHEVDGLSRQQAECLGPALECLEKDAAFSALERVRSALGVNSR